MNCILGLSSLELGCGLSIVASFTLLPYPGHLARPQTLFSASLVVKALGGSRNLIVLPSRTCSIVYRHLCMHLCTFTAGWHSKFISRNTTVAHGFYLTTTHRIKKELSICQSLLCLDLVSFPVLSQIKPQAPFPVAIHALHI